MNKYILFLIIIITLFFSLSSQISAQENIQRDVDVDAEVVSGPLSIENPENTLLDFGKMSTPESGDAQVKVDASFNSIQSQTPFHNGQYQLTEFTVSGPAEEEVVVILPDLVYVEHVDAADYPNDNTDMSVDKFQTSLSENRGSLDAEGDLSFRVGATLNVLSDQVPGKYEGTFEISVLYQ
ncbi:MAG: DUF4402 domain-containing protein [bacterium]